MKKKNLVIITGGSRGLGFALTEIYAKNRWTIKEISRSGQSPDTIKCDLSDIEKSSTIINTLFKELSIKNWQKIVLINNAGALFPTGKVQNKETSDILSNISINFSAAVIITGLFLKYFETKPADKFIVNISSGAAKASYQGWSLYSAGKAALESFSNIVALEQATASNGATTFIINPGKMDTEMQREIRSLSLIDFPLVEKFKQLKNNGSLTKTEEVADAIFYIIASSPDNGGYYSVQDFIEKKRE